jgi:Mg-chelatase subunit ChlD
MLRLLLILILLPIFRLDAQDVLSDRQLWDYGDAMFWKNDTARFKVRNATDKDFVFLPTYYKEDVAVFFNSRLVEPGKSAEIYVVYYTNRKGKFQLDVPLYISSRAEPLVFKLKGNIKGFDPSAQLRCPVVNPANADENSQEKMVQVEIRNRLTDERIKPDDFSVKENNGKRVRLEPHNDGFRMAVIPGNYRISCTKDGFDEYLALITLEPYQSKFIIYMDPKQAEEPVTTGNDVTTGRDATGTELSLMDTAEEEEHVHPDDGMLQSNLFKVNNLVFIVDASMSMKRDGKMETLKSTMAILVSALRSDDRLGVIGFSSDARVIHPHGPVDNKDSIYNRINRLKTEGGTNGGAALKLAYQQAKTHFQADGNNQIVIITDGVFTTGGMSRKAMEKMITEANQEGIHLSTIMVGQHPTGLDLLKHLSTLGGGNNIHILPEANQQSMLLEMVKTQSRR